MRQELCVVCLFVYIILRLDYHYYARVSLARYLKEVVDDGRGGGGEGEETEEYASVKKNKSEKVLRKCLKNHS